MGDRIVDIHGNGVNFENQKILTVHKKPVIVHAFQANVRLTIYSFGKDITVAEPGDYVIRGVQGEYCLCKKEIFEQTYGILEQGEDIIKE